MILTQRQNDVLNFIVEDGQLWADEAENTLGLVKATIAMKAKVVRWESAYDSAVAAGNYKSRATRDAEKLASDPTNPANWSDLEHWKHEIRKTDFGMPRYLEDLITDKFDGNAGPNLQVRYDTKIELRGTKP